VRNTGQQIGEKPAKDQLSGTLSDIKDENLQRAKRDISDMPYTREVEGLSACV